MAFSLTVAGLTVAAHHTAMSRADGSATPGSARSEEIGMSTDQPARPSASRYQEVQDGDDFQDLRRRFRRFVFPLTGLFLGWYFLYVALAAYASGFMSHKLLGNINVGLVFGLLQFVSTFTIAVVYARWADREFDPTADRLRDQIEAGEA
jgi:uncharacterized membrane protein (DUF485 family)